MKKKVNDLLNNNYKRRNILLCFFLSFVIICLSVGFSSFQNNLTIDGALANVRIDKDVRIMGVQVNSVNDAVSNYEDYNVSNIDCGVSLNSSDSYVIYDVNVYNLGNVYTAISSLEIDNDNLKAEFVNYNLGDKICNEDKCTLGVNKVIQVKVSYADGKYDSSNVSQEFVIRFTFGVVYSASYVGFDDTSGFNTVAVEGMEFTSSFTYDASKSLSVTMNGKSLSSGTGYTYNNGVFTIPSVQGDIVITLRDMSYMKSTIIASSTTSGSEDDLTLYDLDSMTSDEKTSAFSNIATDSGVIRIKGITGNSNALVFRGAVTNNYVSFAGNIWRIMQIDEDGNLRLILNNSIGSSQYYTTSSISSEDDAETILGYANSSAKTALDSWYTSNLTDYSEYIVTSKFCNDFTYEEKTSSGASNAVYYYQPYLNVGSDAALYSPSLVCPSNSIFTSNIGLISAEEVVLAGGAYRVANTSYYLYNSSALWTLSPGYYDSTQGNGGVFFVDTTGAVTDWSRSLLTASYALRPVITIDGNLELTGDGTLSNPYMLAGEETLTIAKVDVTDLSSLNNNSYYITNTGGNYNVDGLISSTVSGIGLVGTNTATFSDDKETIVSTTGTLFSFVNGQESTDGYLYQIMTSDGKYLTIGTSDYSVTLSDTPVYLKVSLCTDSSYTGRIVISDETGAMYLNFYGANNTSDDKFAGWNELDKNDYMALYAVTSS